MLLTTTSGICHTHQVEVPEAHRPILFDVRDYATVQGAFDAAYGIGPVYLPGFFDTDAINYRGQSIQGVGMGVSGLIGNPGQDVLHLDPTLAMTAVEGQYWRDFTIRVDDSTSASFPQRDGVGNAGFAVDYADGVNDAPLMMRTADISNVRFDSLSLTPKGQNASCGIFDQFQTFNLSRFRNLFFYRLAYGFRDSYPTSNLTASEHARDHNQYDSLYFNGCGKAWRMVNQANAQVTNLVIHGYEGEGLELLGVTSAIRSGNSDLRFDTVMIENCSISFKAHRTSGCAFENLYINGSAAETVVEFGFSASTVSGFNIYTAVGGSPVVRLTGHNNTLRGGKLNGTGASPFQWDQIDDQGHGNRVELVDYASAAPLNAPASATPDSRVAHSRDVLPLLLGHVNPMPVNLSDLLLNPRTITLGPGSVEGTDYTRVADSTADFRQKLRIPTAGGSWYTEAIGLTGSTWPLTKLRIYVKAKFATGGTQVYEIKSAGVSVGSATLTFTTSYTVQSFDIDLSARSVGEVIQLLGFTVGGGAATPVDIAWVAARPWAADGLIAGSIEAAGVILKSPDGTRYIAKIANGGTWTIAPA